MRFIRCGSLRAADSRSIRKFGVCFAGFWLWSVFCVDFVRDITGFSIIFFFGGGGWRGRSSSFGGRFIRFYFIFSIVFRELGVCDLSVLSICFLKESEIILFFRVVVKIF